MKTIIFTGGHHNSALLLAKSLKQKGYRIVWLGHRHASAVDANISQEYRDVIAADITFIDLKSGKIYRGNIWQAFKTITSFFYCFGLFLRDRPSLVISFGGYLAVPPVIAAWLLKIPSMSHEQTTVMGMANKAIFPFVKKMYLTWPVEPYIHKKKVSLVGLPMDSETVQKIKSLRDLNEILSKTNVNMQFKFDNKPLLVVSGGKQGAHSINELIERNLTHLLNTWNIFHQCGSNMSTRDYQRLMRKRQKLPYDQQMSYVVVDYFYQFRDVLAISDLVIGRSGAHTTLEILMLGKKMIAIPLPLSYEQEQAKNAQKLVDAGLGFLMPQNMINQTNLQEVVTLMKERAVDWDKVRSVRMQTPTTALEVMSGDIEEILE